MINVVHLALVLTSGVYTWHIHTLLAASASRSLSVDQFAIDEEPGHS
jgi:hypothetical protein